MKLTETCIMIGPGIIGDKTDIIQLKQNIDKGKELTIVVNLELKKKVEIGQETVKQITERMKEVTIAISMADRVTVGTIEETLKTGMKILLTGIGISGEIRGQKNIVIGHVTETMTEITDTERGDERAEIVSCMRANSSI